MKKIFLSVLAICAFFVSSAHAQLEKGKKYIGAEVQFSSGTESTSGNKRSGLTLLPNGGYFLQNNFSLGLGIGIQNEKVEGTNTTTNTNLFWIKPHVRYYIPTSSEQFAFYVQGQVEIGTGKVKTTSTTTTTTTNEANLSVTGFSISPNFVFFPTKSWGLEFGVNGFVYESRKTSVNNVSVTQSNVKLDVNSFAPVFGVRYFF